ncbi:MAG: hypothetical protein GY737_22230, partial [Desulfobacteraceae bacterium]|nr:hypothetical protein [Desulfobacteraceae bacterium]
DDLLDFDVLCDLALPLRELGDLLVLGLMLRLLCELLVLLDHELDPLDHELDLLDRLLLELALDDELDVLLLDVLLGVSLPCVGVLGGGGPFGVGVQLLLCCTLFPSGAVESLSTLLPVGDS